MRLTSVKATMNGLCVAGLFAVLAASVAVATPFVGAAGVVGLIVGAGLSR